MHILSELGRGYSASFLLILKFKRFKMSPWGQPLPFRVVRFVLFGKLFMLFILLVSTSRELTMNKSMKCRRGFMSFMCSLKAFRSST